jgi:cellulose synthase/poly-beta-1,6-N-acetylglucosamine synthase-like glycosyltransferase
MSSAGVVISAVLAVLLVLFGIAGLLLVLAKMLWPKRELLRGEIQWPRVVTQLPLYNESAVVERLLRAVAAMRYPAGLHEIQVLDDSTDETAAVVDAVVAELQAAGVNIQVLRRATRIGFKAGALEWGLTQTSAEYAAMFDADFIPEVDFLERMIPPIVGSPRAAFIQGRWGHLNAGDSLLTLAQAAHMDAHFHVQQDARAKADWLMNFNGSAGIWRVSAITDAGGWQGDTLTEDLDLSYRAAMRGWIALYDDDVVVPAEVPTHWSAYRQQQFRWAMGSTQTLQKLLLPLWHSPLGLLRKGIGTMHLAQYCVQPLLLIHCVLMPWLPPVQLVWAGQVLMASALLSAVLPVIRGRGVPVSLAAMMLMGSGMAWTGSCAVWAALKGEERPFQRTPKGKRGLRRGAGFPLAELFLALYAGASVLLQPELRPVMLMHAVGNAFVCWCWWQEVRE